METHTFEGVKQGRFQLTPRHFLKRSGLVQVAAVVLLLSPSARVQAQAARPAINIRRDATVLAVEKAMPSVVNISTKTVVRRRGFFFDWWRENWSPFYQQLPPQYSAGSGVIIDEEGYVLTNVHVVEDATEIEVTLSDNRTYPADLVIGTRKSDVALLKIRSRPGEKFVPIEFAADDDLYLGETVIALGNPFGLGGSVSRGILSSKTRRTTSADAALNIEDWIQTDAAINPGNSGGPLINLNAELIGLNVAIFREGEGIGFAIPVKHIAEAIAQIFTSETLKSLWFGASFKNTTNGITVISVEANSPAGQAGLRKGDIVLRVNDTAPKSVFAANREIIATAGQKEIVLQILRNEETEQFKVRLVPEDSYFNADLIEQKLGVTLAPLTPRAASSLGISGGFVVTDIRRESPADHAGFQRRMIIEAFDGQVAGSIVAAARIVAGKKSGETIRLTLIATNPPRRVPVDLKIQ